MNKTKLVSVILALSLIISLAACTSAPATSTPAPAESTAAPAASTSTPAESTPAPASSEPKKAGFIVMGLGSEFFQGMYDTFVSKFTEAGWEATSVDGQFNPAAQIEAIENFTAMGVDVICIFPVDGAPVDDALKQAQAAGIKVIEMVNCGQNWDVSMISDDFQMAELMNLQAAKWVEDTFPDAADGSIECVAMTYYSSEANKNQSGVALEIEKYNSKIKLVEEYQLTAETTEAGITAAENILTNHPDVKLIITPQGTVAVGVNNYLTSMNSPIKDYSQLGIFSCNAASGESFSAIKASATNEAPMRGTIMTGGVDNTISEMLAFAEGLMDGSISDKFTSYAPYELLQADTIDEFLSKGTITSYTQDNLYADMPTHFHKR